VEIDVLVLDFDRPRITSVELLAHLLEEPTWRE